MAGRLVSHAVPYTVATVKKYERFQIFRERGSLAERFIT